jgi:hypothetical protein
MNAECRCSELLQDGRPPLVIDAGANYGWCFFSCHVHVVGKVHVCSRYFTLLAMSLGCRVLAFEPQMRLLPAIKRSLYFNNFDANKLLALIPCALAKDSNVLTPKDHDNWGEWSLSRSNFNERVMNAGGPSPKEEGITIQATSLDSIVQEDVLVRLIGQFVSECNVGKHDSCFWFCQIS